MVIPHQPCRAMPPDLVSFLHPRGCRWHAGTIIGAVRQREGRPDMRQGVHVLLLAASGRPFLLGKETTLADPEDITRPAE